MVTLRDNMDLQEHAEITEVAETGLERLLVVMHKSGLSYHDIIRIMALRLEGLLIQFEAECQI